MITYFNVYGVKSTNQIEINSNRIQEILAYPSSTPTNEIVTEILTKCETAPTKDRITKLTNDIDSMKAFLQKSV